jgi:hypothetical protein
MATKAQILRLLAKAPRTNAELQHLCCDHGAGIARTMSKLIRDDEADNIAPVKGRGHPALYALPARCVNAHDRCYGGAGGPCPYCERPY